MRYYREHEENKVYTIEDIDNYQYDRLSDNQAKRLVEHCNNHKIYPCICAWYDDMDDFYQDWIYDNNIFTTEEEADDRYEYGCEIGEFLMFDNGEIIRLVV